MPEKKLATGDQPILLEGTKLIPIYIMGKKYDVPESVTIMKALEYAGYQLIRGSGCRGGVCGACATVYRKKDDYKLYTGLACQTVVEPEMYLTQIPFYPAFRSIHNLELLKPEVDEIVKLYPEILKCMGCNTCTKECPQELEVMEFISAALRGDFEKVAELSFHCIMCGICTSRCPAQISQYNIAILIRRLYGKNLMPESSKLERMVEEIKVGKYDRLLDELALKTMDEITELYKKREIEPQISEDWKAKDIQYL